MPLPATYNKLKSRAHYATVPALDPYDGGKWDILISPKTIGWAASRGLGVAKELSYTVRWALENPAYIFLGVRDLDREISDENWLCYAAKPRFAYNLKTGDKVSPAWKNEVFLVFVNDERTVYLWYWCACDAMNAHLPADHEGRFRERVWSHDA